MTGTDQAAGGAIRRPFQGADAVLAAVGTQLGPSSWRKITQQRVDAFARATDDLQWIHVDPQRAAAGPFGGTIAHGYLTLSLLAAFGYELFTVDGLSAKINYGLGKARFPQPVPVGSRIRARAVVSEARETATGVLVTLSWTVEIEDAGAARVGGAGVGGAGVGGEAVSRPACVAEALVLLVR